jgi:hypothetical protein
MIIIAEKLLASQEELRFTEHSVTLSIVLSYIYTGNWGPVVQPVLYYFYFTNQLLRFKSRVSSNSTVTMEVLTRRRFLANGTRIPLRHVTSGGVEPTQAPA